MGKTLVNIKPKKEDNADMVVVMEEDEEEDFLGGRRIEERRPAELKRPTVEEDLRERLGRSREEARRSSIKIEEERSSRMRRRSSEENGMKMDLGMIVKTVVRDEQELKEMRKVDNEDMEVDSEKKKYMEKERELAKQRLMEKELLREERRLEMKE